MPTSQFADACGSALYRTGLCLAHTWTEFGPTDFAEDQAVEMRNTFYRYPYEYFRAMVYFLDHKPEDDWVAKNKSRVLSLDESQLRASACVCHHFAQAHHIPRGEPRHGPLHITLNWLGGMYEVPGSFGERWFRTIAAQRTYAEFAEDIRSLLCSMIADALRAEAIDIEEGGPWAGFAMLVHFSASQIKPSEWEPLCREHFSGYTNELRRLRSR